MNNKEREELLKRYKTPGDTLTYSGRTKVGRELKKSNEDINRDLLSYNFAYGLHRFYRKPKYVNPYFVYFPREQIQVDLIDIKDFHKDNMGTKYLLAAIDIFTRKAWVYPMKDKRAVTSVAIMRKLLEDSGPFLPKAILFDRGKEFVNKLVHQLLKEKKVKIILPNTEAKAAFVERFNQTLQRKIYMHMTQYNTDKYIDNLPNIVASYNKQKHESLGGIFTPNEAEKDENIDKVRYIQMKKRNKIIDKGSKMKPKFKVGDIVRIKSQPGKFNRGYKQQFSREYFQIVYLDYRFPIPTYRLKSLNIGDAIHGIFYENELQIVKGGTFWIEKILKTRIRGRKKEFLVKWTGFGPQHNSWVKEKDMMNTPE